MHYNHITAIPTRMTPLRLKVYSSATEYLDFNLYRLDSRTRHISSGGENGKILETLFEDTRKELTSIYGYAPNYGSWPQWRAEEPDSFVLKVFNWLIDKVNAHNATLLSLHEFKEGDRVVRGKIWPYGNQDMCQGKQQVGTIQGDTLAELKAGKLWIEFDKNKDSVQDLNSCLRLLGCTYTAKGTVRYYCVSSNSLKADISIPSDSSIPLREAALLLGVYPPTGIPVDMDSVYKQRSELWKLIDSSSFCSTPVVPSIPTSSLALIEEDEYLLKSFILPSLIVKNLNSQYE